MKLRVLPHDDAAVPALMLSSDDGTVWCRIDVARVDPSERGGSRTVVLTGMQREQVDGLLDLRAGGPIDLYATPAVFEHLTVALPLLPVLQQFCGVQWHLIPVAGEQREAGFALDHWPTLAFTALTPGDAPAGERIALAVRDEVSGGRLFFAQSLTLDAPAFEWMRQADCVVIDRVPLPHEDDVQPWLERFAQLPSARKLLLHANGTSRAWLARHGIECADEALEIRL